ncbi:hypothetical protein FOZ60_002624 [Perkinsus olseni]|nr:hypothetical protein FOZ60_002624 [Perkinsus olseni]
MSDGKGDRRQYNVLFAEEIMLGLLNNYGYTLVIAGAQDIARLFDKTNLMPLFTTVMLFAAFATGAVHARVAAPFSYRQRVGLAMIIQSIGYLLFGTAFLLVGVQSEVGFWMAQLATFLVGAFQTIGEINNLSILNSLPNGLVGAWGFGTGVSQFVGSISYVIAINLGIS